MQIIIPKISQYILGKIFLVYTKIYTTDYYFSGYSDFSETYYHNQYYSFSVFHIIKFLYFILHFAFAKLRVMYTHTHTHTQSKFISVQIDRSVIHQSIGRNPERLCESQYFIAQLIQI